MSHRRRGRFGARKAEPIVQSVRACRSADETNRAAACELPSLASASKAHSRSLCGAGVLFALELASAMGGISCARPHVDAQRNVPTAPAAGSITAAASRTASDSASMTGPTGDADALGSGTPRKARSIGHTSYVLKDSLDNGAVGAFKPRSNKPLGDSRYMGEIAAYQLAKTLGLNNVPRTIARTFRAADLRSALPSEARAEFDSLAKRNLDDGVTGALTTWVDAYEVLPLESSQWQERWIPWLTDRHAEIPSSARAMAGVISTLIAFDCITANWDRWSGANIARDRATDTVLFVDNDGSFYDPPPRAEIEKKFSLLSRVIRFSRSFVSSLRAIDLDTFRAALREDQG